MTREEILVTIPDALKDSELFDFVNVSDDDVDMRLEVNIFLRNYVYGLPNIDKVHYLSYIDDECTDDVWITNMNEVLYPLLLK